MPGVYREATLMGTIADIGRRLRAMETQQQMVLSNLQGLSVMAFGLIPGSNPPRYGIESIDPDTGNPLAFWGYDSGTDTAVMQFSNSAGGLTLQIDQSGFHYYDGNGDLLREDTATGTTYYDPSGTEEVQLGQLSASPAIYGLAVLNAAGVMQQVAGTLCVSNGGGTASDTTQVDLGTTVTAEIGPSGQALVTLSGSVEVNPNGSASGYAYLGVGVDGGAASQNWVNCQTDSDTLQVTLSLSATRVVPGLTAGSHTFDSYGWLSSAFGSGVFGNVALTVVPL